MLHRFFLGREEDWSTLRVEPAHASDLAPIRELLYRSRWSYSGLGGAIREAVHNDVTLVARQGERIVGVAIVHTQGPRAAWLHAFGVDERAPLTAVGLLLLDALADQLAQQGIVCLAYMDEHALAWLRRLLEAGRFVRETSVVGYETPLATPPTMGNREVLVRPATTADIPAIAGCDQRAFGSLWAYGEQVFRSISGNVACFLIAEKEEALVGYVLATRHGESHAHIVRLAVDPAWQGRKVGARLLAETFLHLRGIGLRTVSLNTQQENVRSQRLYRWFGFRPTGDCIGVWVRRLTAQWESALPAPAGESKPPGGPQ
ncbi:MAG: GNAT family N-acetyltransferase [Chloroflexia bacterium]